MEYAKFPASPPRTSNGPSRLLRGFFPRERVRGQRVCAFISRSDTCARTSLVQYVDLWKPRKAGSSSQTLFRKARIEATEASEENRPINSRISPQLSKGLAFSIPQSFSSSNSNSNPLSHYRSQFTQSQLLTMRAKFWSKRARFPAKAEEAPRVVIKARLNSTLFIFLLSNWLLVSSYDRMRIFGPLLRWGVFRQLGFVRDRPILR